MSPDERCSWGSHALPLIGASASALALLGVELDQTGDRSMIAVWLVAIGLMVATAAWLRRRAASLPTAPSVSPIMLGLMTAPFLIEWLWRLTGGSGHPWEVVLILGVQGVACGLAAAGIWRRHQPLALISSLFVTLFSVTLSGHGVTLAGAGSFLVCGTAWLTANYWTGLEQRMAPRERKRRPWTVALLPVVLLGVLVACFGTTSSDRLWALAGWVPSSGGDGQDDPAARRGVGDGEALVAGQDDIQSFGPIENAPFRASEDPSLYDLFNDLYDEPVVRVKKQDRSIALPPDLVQQLETEMAKSQRATREFSTQRQSRAKGKGAMKNLESDALFYVKGRTPLHLRLELFDLFDGIDWHPSRPIPADQLPPLSMQTIRQRPWLAWPGPNASYEFFGPTETHAIKVVHLDSKRIPTPLQVRGIHVDKLDDPAFFQWADDQLLQMERDRLPELTAIHLRSQTIDPERVAQWKFWGIAREPRTRVVPTLPEMDRVRALAERWTEGVPHGMPQVAAIVQRLRNEYHLDPEARAPEEAAAPVVHFLFESHRGPDYQFATAAALLLRSLGFSTRLVGGFYASPDRYDAQKRHTPVVSADAHVWVELHLSGNQWVTIEPTPGYRVLKPPPDFIERVWMLGEALAGWIAARAWPLGFATIGLIAAWWWRHALLLGIAEGWWLAWPANQPRERIRQTLRLLDLRGRLRGKPRPPACPPGRWLAGWLLAPDGLPTLPTEFARLADWAHFAPESVAVPVRDWASVCRAVVVASRQTPRAASNTDERSTPSVPEHLPLVTLRIGNISPS